MIQIISPEFTTFLISALPIAELRGSIPVALGLYKMSLGASLFWSLLGNALAVFLVLCLLEPISKFLSHKYYICNRFFAWLFEKTRKKHSRSFEFLGSFALILFVAIPLPMTGGWSGAIAAFVFGIPLKKAFPLILVGLLIAAVIVTLLTLGVLAI